MSTLNVETVLTNTLGTNGAPNISTAPLQLPTFGGTPSSLDYYEETTMNCQFTGPWDSPQNSFLTFVRVGKNVTMTIWNITAVATTSSQVNCNVFVPSRFLPRSGTTSNASNFVISVKSGNTYGAGLLQVNSISGLLVMYATPAKGLFPSVGGLTGWDQIIVSWNTA